MKYQQVKIGKEHKWEKSDELDSHHAQNEDRHQYVLCACDIQDWQWYK